MSVHSLILFIINYINNVKFVFGTNSSMWTALSSNSQLVGRDQFSIKMELAEC